MTKPTLYTHEGYEMAVRSNGTVNTVDVYDPRYTHAPAVYSTTSLDKAMRWIDAYIAGAQWAQRSPRLTTPRSAPPRPRKISRWLAT
jgi:hypothetical protein